MKTYECVYSGDVALLLTVKKMEQIEQKIGEWLRDVSRRTSTPLSMLDCAISFRKTPDGREDTFP